MAKDKGGKASKGGDAKKLRKLMKSARVAMLTTVAPDGTLRSRPMANLKAPFEGDLWFFTRAGAPKASEIRDDERVNVSFADPDSDRYLSVTGRASVVRDEARMADLWSGKLKAWFPDGRKDPDLALLRVRVERAETWDPEASAMVEVTGLDRDGAAQERRVEAGPPATPGAGAQG